MSFSLGRVVAALTIASFALSANAQTILCEPAGAGGLVPTAGTGDGTYQAVLPSFPLITTTTCTSTGSPEVLTEIKLNGFTHTWVGDVHVVLESPSFVKYNIFCRGGLVDFSCDYSGNYVFADQCAPGNLALPAACTTIFPAGQYAQNFGSWTSGTNGIVNTPMNSIIAEPGTWTLYMYDWVGADGGTLTSWELCWGNPHTAIPAPTLASPANGGSAPHQATLTWNPACFATSYDVDIDGAVTTGVVGTSLSYFVGEGSHTWAVRGVNGGGPGAYSPTRTFNVLPPAANVCSELTTTFVSNNGGNVGGQVFFNLNVTNAAGITLGSLYTNTSLAAGGAFTMSVYTKSGTSVGFENNLGAWTLSASGAGVAAGLNMPSLVEFTDFPLAAGTHGVALIIHGAAHSYTGTAAIPPVTLFSNADLSIQGGKALNVPWTGTPFSPRMWDGTVRYNCMPGSPFTFCTAGTSSNNCVPVISANAQPQIDLGGPCVVTVNTVEGNRAAILFYGLDNSGYVPVAWGPSSSYLCIKPPTQRTGQTMSTGTDNMCDGVLTLDWNAYITANPTALGAPFAVGDTVYVQAWYRDPPSPKTTHLSAAIELVMQP